MLMSGKRIVEQDAITLMMRPVWPAGERSRCGPDVYGAGPADDGLRRAKLQLEPSKRGECLGRDEIPNPWLCVDQ